MLEDCSLTGSGSDYFIRILATGFGGSVDMTNVSLLRTEDGAGFVMRNGTLIALARQDAACEAGARLDGRVAADWLRGAGGNDTLIGTGGGDRLEGGAGDDWIEPGSRTGAADPVSNVIHGGGLPMASRPRSMASSPPAPPFTASSAACPGKARPTTCGGG